MKEVLTFRDRQNTNCEKWDGLADQFGQSDLLPLWVADMDFEAPLCVQEALAAYLKTAVYGYYHPPKEYLESFIKWEADWHTYQVEKEWIRFVPGVVPAIYWMIQTVTKPQEHVLILPPVYYPFFHAIEESDRRLSQCPLRYGEDGSYTMDLRGIEQCIKEEQVKLFLLCSPHNPAGRVWKREELKAVLDLCKKYHVFVLADEIHQDLILEPNKQIAAATVGDYDSILVTVTSATKTFNIAGCQNAFIILPDAEIRRKFDQTLCRLHMKEGSSFGYVAVQAAYTYGRPWLELVRKQILENYNCLKTKLIKLLPEAILTPLEGTYLAWINLEAYLKNADVCETVQGKCHLAVDYGEWFGGEQYRSFIRINLATKQEYIEEAVKRLAKELVPM